MGHSLNASEQVDSLILNNYEKKNRRQKATSEFNNLEHPSGFRGLAGSERVKGRKTQEWKTEGGKIEEVETGLPFLFLLWALGRSVWIAMLIGNGKYEEITQNPLDFLTPTWMRPQLFRWLVAIHWGPERSPPISLGLDSHFVIGIKSSGTEQALIFVGYCYNWQIKY